jgi:hypothetical protein
MHTGFSYETLKERNHLEGLSTDGSIIFQQILKKQGHGMGLSGSGCGQVVDPVNMVMNLQVTQTVVNLISSVLLASQGGLSSEVGK